MPDEAALGKRAEKIWQGRCGQEMCGEWTGEGCACAVLGIEPSCGACAAETHQHCERVRTRGLACCCNDVDDDV